MKPISLFVAILFMAISTLPAQETPQEDNLLGFACFEGGTASQTTLRVEKLFQNKNYQALSTLLTSQLTSEQFLSCITLEYLGQRGLYQLTEEERSRIKAIRNSDASVEFCSGCLLMGEVSLKSLFAGEAYQEAGYWVRGLDKKN